MLRRRALVASPLALAVVSLAMACGTTLSDAGAKVELMRGDPPTECRELGAVTGYSSIRGGALDKDKTLEESKSAIRNTAADRGANYVRWETTSANGSTVTGVAYTCPQGEKGSSGSGSGSGSPDASAEVVP